jgi:hypothetical protein
MTTSGFSEEEVQFMEFLTKNTDFASSTTVREQCYWACELFAGLCNDRSRVPFASIGRILGVNRALVSRNWNLFRKQGNENRKAGRPCILTDDEHNDIVDEILDAFDRNRPLTVHEVCRIIEERCGKVILPDTISHIMAREKRIRTCKAKPMEEARLEVTDDEIMQYFRELYSKVHGVPAHFVLNMDEMGHQPYADAKDTVCFVPSSFTDPVVRYPVSRVGKRITLIGAVFADGSYLKPGLIIPRQTHDDCVICRGYTAEKVEVYTQKKGFIDQNIFEDWVADVLIPELRHRRELHQYHGPSIIILDNCSSHHGAAFHQLCIENRIECVWLPPHSSHLLQVLDLSLFGVTKKFLNRLNSGESKYIQANHIIRVLDCFHSAACPGNITGSFRLGGISVMLDDKIPRCIITPQTARRVLHVFVEPELRKEFVDPIEEEEDEGEYVTEDDVEDENIRIVVEELRAMLEGI